MTDVRPLFATLQSTPNFPKNEHFLPPYTHKYACISGGKKCSFSENFACFVYVKQPFWYSPFRLLPTNSCQSFNLAELNQTALSPSPKQVLDHWQKLQNNKVKSFKITENTFWMMSFWDREHYFWKIYLALMINLKKYFPTGLFAGDFKQLFLWSYWTMRTDTTQQSFKEVKVST